MAVDDGTVFVGRRDGQFAEDGEFVYALDGADGEGLWRTETGDVGPTGHAARRGVLFADTTRRLRALDVEGGEERWSAQAESHAYDNRAERVFGQQEGLVSGVGYADGEELWRRGFDFVVSRITSPRAAGDETVFVGDSSGRLLALSPLEGNTRWELSVDRNGSFRPSVARASERLYVAGAGVHAVDPVSGDRAWAFEPDVEERVQVQTGAPSTVFAHSDRHVWALDPDAGDRGGPSSRAPGSPASRPPATSRSSASTARSTPWTGAGRRSGRRYSSDMSAVQRSAPASAFFRSILARMAAASDAVSAAFASPSVRNSPVTRFA